MKKISANIRAPVQPKPVGRGPVVHVKQLDDFAESFVHAVGENHVARILISFASLLLRSLVF